MSIFLKKRIKARAYPFIDEKNSENEVLYIFW